MTNTHIPSEQYPQSSVANPEIEEDREDFFSDIDEEMVQEDSRPYERSAYLLLLREKLGETAVGAIVGGVIVDEDFSAWPPLEVYSQKPRHFGKFLAKQGLGRSALWPALLQYGESNGISMYAAEAWDFTYDGLPKDNLKEYYTSLGMEWHGTVIYRNKYYDNSVIGDKRPVNRFLYRLDSQPPRP